ncbi:polysaccharide lyase family 7 protein [Roseibacterium beibuensis]|uniref:Alginate lyase 2 domain-containing protein n=1 Tax=[Roseibacterium] beibuensis TaxID=1193142 RepID=A0ABP9L3W5_9RHOB|nr:polysaccharide lyase family 7 protein [Roseibacterium beibuensis]MCS6623737.1 polysaccharide lyase family 7 protein [Roseibacterium beibuensis]
MAENLVQFPEGPISDWTFSGLVDPSDVTLSNGVGGAGFDTTGAAYKGIYDQSAMAWIINAGFRPYDSPPSAVPAQEVLQFTTPANCTSIRLYPARASGSAYLYIVVPVLPETDYVATFWHQLVDGQHRVGGVALWQGREPPSATPRGPTVIASANASGLTSVTTAKPAGTSDGDLLLFFGSSDNSPGLTYTPPEGVSNSLFTRREANHDGAAITAEGWWKIADGEGPDYTLSMSGAKDTNFSILRIPGAFVPGPIDDVQVIVSTSNSEPVLPGSGGMSLTMDHKNSRVIRFVAWDGSKTVTEAPSWDHSVLRHVDFSGEDQFFLEFEQADGSWLRPAAVNLSGPTRWIGVTLVIRMNGEGPVTGEFDLPDNLGSGSGTLAGILPSGWKWQAPVNGLGDRSATDDNIEVDDLEGYENGPWYDIDTDGRLLLLAPADGATTPNTSYPRSELREMNGDDLAAWSFDGYARLDFETTILHTAYDVDGLPGEIIFAQVHGNAAGELCRLTFDGKGGVFYTNEHAPDGQGGTIDVDTPLLDDQGNPTDIRRGETMTGTILVSEGTLTVSMVHEGVTYSASAAIDPYWTGADLYFKAGVYSLVGAIGSGAGSEGHGYAAVLLSSAKVSHAMPGSARFMVWTGTGFVEAPLACYDGTAFVDRPLKRFDGSAWS